MRLGTSAQLALKRSVTVAVIQEQMAKPRALKRATAHLSIPEQTEFNAIKNCRGRIATPENLLQHWAETDCQK